MTKTQKMERDAAIEKLRELVKPGDEVRTILRHVARSGMSRSVSVIIGTGGFEDRSYLVARALGDSIDQKNGGVKVGGCGMDAGAHLIYHLGRVLFPDGFECCGYAHGAPSHSCPSNDHSNGDKNYAADHRHSDGGYALRHRWL